MRFRFQVSEMGARLAAMTQDTANFKVGNEKLIKVLDGASSHLRGLLGKQGRPEGVLRIAVIGGGCSGLQYKMDLVDGPRDRDILVPSNEVNVVIDPKSALFVSGSELDYSDDLQQGGFKVRPPQDSARGSFVRPFVLDQAHEHLFKPVGLVP